MVAGGGAIGISAGRERTLGYWWRDRTMGDIDMYIDESVDVYADECDFGNFLYPNPPQPTQLNPKPPSPLSLICNCEVY